LTGNWRPLGAHTTPNPSKIAEALARRVQWAVREELELDDPALQGLAAEPVVDLTIGDASRSLLLEIASRKQLGSLGASMGCIYGNGVPYWLFGLSTPGVLLQSFLDKAEEDAHRQQRLEGAQRQQQRAQEEHGVCKQTADKLPSPGAEKRVTRGMKALTK
jgi:hypothetical protein